MISYQHQRDAAEAVVADVWSRSGHFMRGQPISKVVGRGPKARTVFTKKNGVDFVGVLHGRPCAVECKRLPGAASLRGSKDDSTRTEARWLLEFGVWPNACAGFLVYDPEARDGEGDVYLVQANIHLHDLSCGGVVQLRAMGLECVSAWNAPDLTIAVSAALARLTD